MTKKEITLEFYQRYLRNEPLTEYEVLTNAPTFFKNILKEFGTWHKFEKEIGFLNRHLREREKFFLYMVMKKRKERFGPMSLRHKYIEEELKNRISECFGTVKKLSKDILESDCQERVLFDAHSFFITGGTPSELKRDNQELYKRISSFFIDETHFYEEYENKFLIQPLSLEEVKEVSKTTSDTLTDIQAKENSMLNVDALVAIGYMTKEQAEQIKAAASIEKEEVFDFVSNLPSDYTISSLQKENPVMWIAINNLGGIDSVKEKLKRSMQVS